MTVEATQQVAPTETQKTPEHNFAQIRKQLEQERAGRMAIEEELAQLKQAAQKTKYDQDDDSEPYVDSKKLNRKFAEYDEVLEKKIEKKAEYIAQTMIERERQQSFLKANPDFQQILSPEMLQKFVEKHPDMAEPMLEMPDNFARQKLLYQNIKALGLHRPAAPEVSIQQKIDANRKSPYYQPSGSNTPPFASQGDFTDGGQKNAYSKMQDLIRNRRG
jgi:hypothetical protein